MADRNEFGELVIGSAEEEQWDAERQALLEEAQQEAEYDTYLEGLVYEMAARGEELEAELDRIGAVLEGIREELYD